jgi:hypothetical protein
VIRPFHAATVGYDSASSVVYFDRIISGHLLEADLGATPKPLLTLVFGALYSAFQDWRPLLWMTLAIYAAGIGGASVLARRVGGLSSGVFVAVGLVASATLLVDASRAYAVSWGLLGWVIAGLALTSRRRHYAVAGLALLFATLARIETLVVVVVAAVALVVSVLIAYRRHTSAPPRSATFLLLGFIAIPVLMVHDQLLIHDPFYWVHVAERYSAAHPGAVDTPAHVLLREVVLFVRLGGMTLLAALGGATLLIRRHDVIALGLIGLGPGICVFLVLLAARGTYVSTRYLTPIELATIFAAGIGFGSLRVSWLRDGVVRRALSRRAPRIRLPVAVGAVVVVSAVTAVCASRTFAPIDRTTTSLIHSELTQAENSDRVAPFVRQAVASPPGHVGRPSVLLVPAIARPRFAVDTGLPVTSIGSLEDALQRGTLAKVPGRLIYHDRLANPSEPFAMLGSDRPPTIDGVVLLPVAADPTRGYWLWRVPDGSSGPESRDRPDVPLSADLDASERRF